MTRRTGNNYSGARWTYSSRRNTPRPSGIPLFRAYKQALENGASYSEIKARYAAWLKSDLETGRGPENGEDGP